MRWMSLSLVTLLLAGVGIAAAQAASAGQGSQAPGQQTPVKSRGDQQTIRIQPGVAQLFVDNELIDQKRDLERTLHCPKKDDGAQKPLLAIDQEFGGTPSTLEANGSIVFDPKIGKYVMFALGFSSTAKTDRVRLFRFTSPDAMHWIKGDDGKPERIAINLSDPDGGKPATNVDLFSCYYDARDTNHPYKGWINLANFDHEGIWFVQSADGRTWERGGLIARAGARTIHQGSRTLRGPGDVNIIYHDELDDRLLALLKFNAPSEDAVNGNLLRSRAYLFVNRPDQPLNLDAITHVDLVPSCAKANGDLPADEYYASTGWRYGSLWLGGLKVWHHAGDYPYSAAGSAFLKLVVSHDGLHWKKVPFKNDAGEPEVFIPNGPEGGNHGQDDGGYITEFSQGPLRIGDELIYYYGCSSWGKNQPRQLHVTGGGIFRARLRPDGFVSVDGGALTTKPLRIPSGNLLLNSNGPVAVEVLDAEGNVLASAAINGDALAHEVRFAPVSFLQLVRNRTVRLRFSIGGGGHLYSFTVGAPEKR